MGPERRAIPDTWDSSATPAGEAYHHWGWYNGHFQGYVRLSDPAYYPGAWSIDPFVVNHANPGPNESSSRSAFMIHGGWQSARVRVLAVARLHPPPVPGDPGAAREVGQLDREQEDPEWAEALRRLLVVLASSSAAACCLSLAVAAGCAGSRSAASRSTAPATLPRPAGPLARARWPAGSVHAGDLLHDDGVRLWRVPLSGEPVGPMEAPEGARLRDQRCARRPRPRLRRHGRSAPAAERAVVVPLPAARRRQRPDGRHDRPLRRHRVADLPPHPERGARRRAALLDPSHESCNEAPSTCGSR